MKNFLMRLFFILSFFLFCNAEDTYSLAIDNRAEEVVHVFEGYRLEVYTNKLLTKEPSPSTKAIYGNINGESTLSLLKISSNYVNGDSFIVRVYDSDTLVGETLSMFLEGSALRFDDIIIKVEQIDAEKTLLMILSNRSKQINNRKFNSKFINIPTLLIIESLENKK